jgi:uncharacterized protein (UPF0333 family)
MNEKRKGQVALEFLMTYGWAFLIILVVIGAFVYFDVFNSSRLVSESCTFPAGISCIDQTAKASDSNISVILRNGFGTSIIVDRNTTMNYYKAGQRCTLEISFPNTNWDHNEHQTLTWDMSSVAEDCNLTSNELLMGTVIFEYRPSSSSFYRQAEGSVSIPVQP